MPLLVRYSKPLAATLAIVFVALNAANALSKGGDALVFFEGGRRLLHALPLYAGSSAADGFIGPPFQALFFAPFAAINAYSPAIAALAWYIVNLACLALAMKWTLQAWSATRERMNLPRRAWSAMIAVPLLAVLLPLQTNFEHQNMNALLLALIAGATVTLTIGAPLVAGMLIGVATALKAFPALLIVYLAARRLWTACAASIATATLLTVLPALVYGVSGFRELMATWVRLGSSGWPIRGNNQSLVAALDRFTGAFDATGVRTAAEAPLAMMLFIGAAIVLIAVALPVLLRRRDDVVIAGEVAVVTVLAVLLTPIAWDHYWTLMLPAFVIVYDRIEDQSIGSRARLAFWSAALLVTAVSPLTLGRRGFDLARQLSTNTMAALILYATLLMICRRMIAKSRST